MRGHFNSQSIYIKDVLILHETCPNCNCTHSYQSELTNQKANPIHESKGKHIFFQWLEQNNWPMDKFNIDLGELQQAFNDFILQNLKENENKWMDSQDVMLKLSISKRTLQTLRNNGTLPFTYIKNKTYYKVSDVDALLEKNYAAQKSKSDETE